jgi:hypothetical protein
MRRRNNSLWEYLDSIGILEKGNDEEIKQAKNTYWKQYFLEHKRKQRTKKPEFSVNFSSENGEFSRIKTAAKRHKMPITSFIRSATLAYIENRYVVPDPMQIAHMEQVLADCLNEIQTLVKRKEHLFFSREVKMEAIEKRIIKLEGQIDEIFRNPPLTQ